MMNIQVIDVFHDVIKTHTHTHQKTKQFNRSFFADTVPGRSFKGMIVTLLGVFQSIPGAMTLTLF